MLDFESIVDPHQIWIAITDYWIDLAPNEIPFGVKSIGEVQLQSKFGLDYQNSDKISLCIRIRSFFAAEIVFIYCASTEWAGIFLGCWSFYTVKKTLYFFMDILEILLLP